MPMFTVDVTPDHGDPFRVAVESRDAAQWERRYPKANWSEYEQAPNILDSYRMIHIAATRHGLYGGTLDDLMNGADFAFLTGGDEPEDPTPSAV